MPQSGDTKQILVIYVQPTPCINPITHWFIENKRPIVAMVKSISKSNEYNGRQRTEERSC